MLEKLVLFIVTVIVTLASNLAPASFLTGTPDAGVAVDPGLGGTGTVSATPSMQQFAFATVDATGTTPFARLSVLWVEINGVRLHEDEWGSGHIGELKFQVGLKSTEGRGLRMGDAPIPVRPTDNFTIRGFTGRYQVANIQTSSATISLQGTVAATGVNEGSLRDLKTFTDAKPGVRENLAYVVLEGKRGDAVAITHADAQRTFTRTEATSQTPGHLGARAVRVNGQDVLENAWGDGPLASIGFDVVVPSGVTETVSFNGKDLVLRTGQRVEIRDFIGTYVVFQVAGGLQKVKLDGVAKTVSTNSTALGVGPLGILNQPPVVQASYLPLAPTTATAIRFSDESRDPDVGGFILFRTWDFGDGSGPSSEGRPVHRYVHKGTYTVTLTVTDNTLDKNTTRFNVTVDNAPPHTDFNWYPKTPTTFFDIPFQDLSTDIDGSVVAYQWDFGDGGYSSLRNPTHRFTQPGAFNVTLTATDNEGSYWSVTKVVVVQNSPPTVAFRWSPEPAVATYPILFSDESVDLDGFIIQRAWNFPSTAPKAGATVSFVFSRAGTYPVSLTVTDNNGESVTLKRDVQVLNSPPTANFTLPAGFPPAGTPVLIEDRSADRDGRIVNWTWDFGDGDGSFAKNPTHVFRNHGNYTITLTVTDDDGGKDSVTRVLSVDHAVPQPDFDVNPRVASTGSKFTFLDRSTHLDGTLASWFWEFGDGANSTLQNPEHVYADNCVCSVKLTVRDTEGRTNWVRHTVTVLNRPPVVDFIAITPASPAAGQAVTFNATFHDPDGTLNPATVRWDFADTTFMSAANTTHVFLRSGTYVVKFSVADDDGGVGSREYNLVVTKAPPIANFSWSPALPSTNAPMFFTDTTLYTEDAPGTWSWDFGDGTPGSTLKNPSHVYTRGGNYTVRLTVVDSGTPQGAEAQVSRVVRVNGPPTVSFAWTPTFPEAGLPATFRDLSTDDFGIGARLWTFGALNTSTERNPTFTFPEPGEYDVSLKITDTDGVSRTRVVRVTAINTPPVADFTVSPSLVIQNQDAFFVDRSTDKTGPIASWEWSFGDGSTADTPNVTHRFQEPGYYPVTLSVRDQEGALGTSTRPALRVAADHAYRIVVDARLPDALHSRANLRTSSNVEITVKNLATTQRLSLARNITLETDGTAVATFGPGAWAPGDRFEISVSVGSYKATGVMRSDYDELKSAAHLVEVGLTAPLKLSLEVLPSAVQSPLMTYSTRQPGPTTFTMPDEIVRVRAKVTWYNNEPVEGATVMLTATWTITKDRQPSLEGAVYQALTSRSENGLTNETGQAVIVVPPPPDETGRQLVYGPGWYEVTGDATLGTVNEPALVNGKPTVWFYEDPGGLNSFG